MNRKSVWLFTVSVATVVVALCLFANSFESGSVLMLLGGSVWDSFAAIGTVGATIVALLLAFRGFARERVLVAREDALVRREREREAQDLAKDRNAIARLVSAWVTEEFTPRTDEPSYRRVAVVHVANESDEPVFDAHLSVVVGQDDIPLGPLSAPSPIAVLPQRRSREFDISQPLRAHDDTSNLRVELSFTDSRGQRWLRGADGSLAEEIGAAGTWVDGENDERQLGIQTLENPLFVALLFLAGVQANDPTNDTSVDLLLAPEAQAAWDEVDWDVLRAEYRDYTPTSMVDYPAPYVARVKLNGDTSLQGKRVQGERLTLPVKLLTLTFAPGRGWRIWGLGGTATPDRILFPDGTFGL